MFVASQTREREEVTEVERHLLGRVASHSWTHKGRIPYVPPNTQQAAVARRMAAAGRRWLEPTVTLEGQQSYRLTHYGERLVRRLFRLTPLEQAIQREHEYDYFSALLCHPGRRARILS